MILKFPIALTVAAVFSAIGAGLYLACCMIHFARTVKQIRKEPEHVPASESSVQSLVAVRFVYDFEYCLTLSELKETIQYINEQRFVLVNVTQCNQIYTVFFRRMLNG